LKSGSVLNSFPILMSGCGKRPETGVAASGSALAPEPTPHTGVGLLASQIVNPDFPSFLSLF